MEEFFFIFLETWKRRVRNCHIDMSIIGGGEESTINNLEGESDSEPDDIENDEVTKTSKLIKNSFCIEKQWGDDDENPSGINFKSKLPHFKKLVETLRKVFRKGSVKAIGKIKTYAEEVKRKNTGTEVKINITDPEGEGEVVLSFWGPHKKTKDITVQINSKKGSEKRFVKLFADEFVRKILERLSNGIQIEELFEKGEAKVACTICSKMFLREATLKTHMKSHIICNKCGV